MTGKPFLPAYALKALLKRKQLIKFIRESNLIEGIDRDPTQDEIKELQRFLSLKTLTVEDIIHFVNVYEPKAKLRAQKGLDVYVGKEKMPSGGVSIVFALTELLKVDINSDTPWKFHHKYECLHPFTDGNGRSGRAIWLWMMKGKAPLGFLHSFYYQTLKEIRRETCQ